MKKHRIKPMRWADRWIQETADSLIVEAQKHSVRDRDTSRIVGGLDRLADFIRNGGITIILRAVKARKGNKDANL